MWFLEGVLTSVVGTAILVIRGLLLAWRSGRRRITDFFNLVPSGIHVYVSRISVRSGGFFGVDGQPRNYSGGAMPENELEIIAGIEEFFPQLTPRLGQLPGRLSLLRFQWDDVKVRISLAPVSANSLDVKATLFVTGSPARNVSARVVDDEFSGSGGFAPSFDAIVVEEKRFHLVTNAIVQRHFHLETGQRAFYVAGFSVLGTTAAGKYLFDTGGILQRSISLTSRLR